MNIKFYFQNKKGYHNKLLAPWGFRSLSAEIFLAVYQKCFKEV